jgi:hypothetical protein
MVAVSSACWLLTCRILQPKRRWTSNYTASHSRRSCWSVSYERKPPLCRFQRQVNTPSCWVTAGRPREPRLDYWNGSQTNFENNSSSSPVGAGCEHEHEHANASAQNACIPPCVFVATGCLIKHKHRDHKPEGRGFDSQWGEFWIYLILPVELGPGVYSASNRN